MNLATPDRFRFLRVAVLPLAACLLLAMLAHAQSDAGVATTAPASAPTSAVSAAPPMPEDYYGAYVLIPPLVTIVLAIGLRQVIPALSVGVLVAAFMYLPCAPASENFGGGVIGGLRLAVETYFIGAISDRDHVTIIVFTMMIGGTVGIIAANGGTRAAVDRVARWASTRERGQLATWFAGLVVFIDDYANAMIVGPAMRPVCDRLRISRAKLSYIVDSTAAPVSSIALIGTWVGMEIGYIGDGMEGLTNPPAFLSDVTAYKAFLASIPYRFYPILALVLVFLVGWLGRDFGPMLRAEREAGNRNADDGAATEAEGPAGRAWYAVLPVTVLVVVTLILLGVTGWYEQSKEFIENSDWWTITQAVISDASSNTALLYGSLTGLLLAGAIALGTRTLNLTQTVDAALEAVQRMMPTFAVLVLAWSLSAGMKSLRLGYVATELLQSHGFDATWLPLLVFVSSCIVSFATGTSWGTIGILCPATVTIASSMLADLPTDQAQPLFYAAVGSVLSGSVFGDHCSPISDTTVLSSLASSCSLEQHVWTQIPYALTACLVSVACGDVFCRYYGQPAWLGLVLGTILLGVIVLAIGRKAGPATSTATAG